MTRVYVGRKDADANILCFARVFTKVGRADSVVESGTFAKVAACEIAVVHHDWVYHRFFAFHRQFLAARRLFLWLGTYPYE